MRNRAIAVLVAAALAACSGGGSSTLPSAPQAQNRKVLARLTIKVPHPSRAHRRRGRYISPATASLAYSIDGAVQTPVAISPSSPNCTVNNAISYLQCSVNLEVAPGNHTFSFTTKDAGGKVLSANTNVTSTVVAGAANTIAVSLGGVASSLALYPPVVPQVVAASGGGYRIYGRNALPFSIVPKDADGNAIVGPGAPQPVMSSAPASMTMQTPAPASPNLWTFTSTYAAADPTVAKSSSISVSATPVPNSGGSTVSLSIPLSLYVPWVYATSENGGDSVQVTDELGNPQTISGTFPNLSSVNQIVYDTHNKLLYVANGGTHQITYYDTNGNYVGSFSGSDQPGGIAFDSHNDFLYVTYYNTNTVSVYDESGNLQTTAGGFPGTQYPWPVVYDPSDSFIYVGNLSGGVNVYDEQGNLQTTTGGFPNASIIYGLVYDPANSWVFGVNQNPAVVLAYDGQGNQQTLSGFGGLGAAPSSLAYDPHNDWFYVGDCSGDGTPVKAFSSSGTPEALGGAWAAQVPGITVAP
jgi:DNA-binding beta-propeller fold protein YncE